MKETDFRVQAWKNGAESLAHLAARHFGRSDIASSFSHGLQQKFGERGTQWLLTALGIGAGTVANIKNVPSWVQDIFASAGLDPAAASNILNEAMDSVFRGTLDEMKDLNEDKIRALMDARVRELTAEGGKHHGTFSRLILDLKKMKVHLATEQETPDGPRSRKLHATSCPNCVERKPTRQVRGTTTAPRYGGHIFDVVRDVEVGNCPEFEATQDPCCGPQIEKIVKAARRKLMTLHEIIAKLRRDNAADPEVVQAFTAYDHGFAAAPPVQRTILDGLAAQKAWEEDGDVVLMFVRQCRIPGGGFDTVEFIQRLRTKVQQPTGHGAPASPLAGLAGPVEEVRRVVQGVTASLQESGAGSSAVDNFLSNILGE